MLITEDIDVDPGEDRYVNDGLLCNFPLFTPHRGLLPLLAFQDQELKQYFVAGGDDGDLYEGLDGRPMTRLLGVLQTLELPTLRVSLLKCSLGHICVLVLDLMIWPV